MFLIFFSGNKGSFNHVRLRYIQGGEKIISLVPRSAVVLLISQ